MKNNYLIFILFAVMFTYACNDKEFLEELPKDEISSENLTSTVDGFSTLITGIHAHCREQFEWTEDWIPYYAMHTGVDYAVSHRPWGIFQKAYHEYGSALHPEERLVKGTWNWAYKAIANCNMVIEAAQTNEAIDKQVLNKFEAEARFFRAYFYNFLVTLYGNVPLVDKPAKERKYDYIRESKQTILEFMISDLVFASEHLADISALEQEGRIPRGAALHLLTEVYLHNGNNELAENAGLELINSGNYKLMDYRFGAMAGEPGDSFSDLFLENNQNRASGNLESIWAIQQEYSVEGGGGPWTDWSRRIWVPYYSQVPGLVLCDSLGGRGQGRLTPTEYWWNLFESVDMRVSDFNVRRKYYVNNSSEEYEDIYGTEIVITEELTNAGSLYPSIKKFNFFREEDPSHIANAKDIMMMRLAETYLLVAEAQFKQGKLSQAAENINVVRRRANATEINAGDVNLSYILDERARELIGEYPRRFTLVRTGTLVERVRLYNPGPAGQNITEREMLWPIPQSAIDANFGAIIDQNPGY